MAIEKQRLWLTFGEETVSKPIISDMTRKFDVSFNIRNASVKANIGIIAMEIEGERRVIGETIRWLESNGVLVEPVEINIIEG
ncbi:MAG: NIL domain-containing protein [Candidatus Methylacidiphilales bacterium]|nr:NIL domain-containing protein [Candidatus Methylacidiphilales bacterium]